MTTKSVKDDITETACKMFLKKAYDDVAMRDIAEALNISVENLTYHFKKKADLAEAVVVKMFKEHKPKTPCNSLEELDKRIAAFDKFGDEDAFYFKNFEKFAQISQTMRQIQQEVFKRNLEFWYETFNNLRKNGMLEPEGFDGQYEVFVHNFYLIKAHSDTQKLLQTKLGNKKIDFYFRIWISLYSLLTEKGKQTFKEKIRL